MVHQATRFAGFALGIALLAAVVGAGSTFAQEEEQGVSVQLTPIRGSGVSGTATLKDVEEVMRVGGVHAIMLDNMDLETLRKAIVLIGGAYKTEASGGINEETIRGVAETGVDFISVGAVTHSIASLDMSLKAF